MSDLIDRQAAIDALNDTITLTGRVNVEATMEYIRSVADRLNRLPSAQPEIVRCKDCFMHGVCRFEQYLGLDGYCSKAERRTDDLQ